jgi:hypothetical protein
MGGGLIQIVSYGSEDITLTGNPEITFFTTVYRRYTNFGFRNIILDFDNTIGFDTTSYLNIPKNSGDLISNLILKINLPKIDFTKVNNLLTKKDDISEEYYVYYNYYVNFYNKLKNLINIFFAETDLKDTKYAYISGLNNYIEDKITIDEFYQFFIAIDFFYNYNNFTNIKYNISNYTNASLYKIIEDNLIYIYRNLNEESVTYDGFKNLVNKNLEILDDLNGILFNKFLDKLKDTQITGAWVNKIGIYILNSVEFYIGSIKIDELSADYINKYSNLYYENKGLYNEMIGTDAAINNFKIKHDNYLLYLPLPFWFINNYGLAFPLIALQYNSIQIKINTKKLEECIKINIADGFNDITIREDILISLTNNVANILNSKLQITLLAEYVYLDSIERKKFAQTAHEYLIQQVQEIEFNNLILSKNSFELDFFHCCKDLFWSINKIFNISDVFDNDINYYSYQLKNFKEDELKRESLNNYIVYERMINNPEILFDIEKFINGIYFYDNNLLSIKIALDVKNKLNINIILNVYDYIIKDIINSSKITINSSILINENSSFFNNLEPYNYYNSKPENGLYVYSFSLKPTEFQPSGSCNFSKIPSCNLVINIQDDEILKKIYNSTIYEKYYSKFNNRFKLVIQARNFNILRIIGGIAGIAYTY